MGHRDITSTQWYTHLADDTKIKAMYKHPLMRNDVSPYDLMQQVKEVIQNYRFYEDSRFHYELSEGNDGIRMSLFVR